MEKHPANVISNLEMLRIAVEKTGLLTGHLKEWVDYCNYISDTYKVNVLLGGGAIRDTLYNVPINDIDIFISLTKEYKNGWAGCNAEFDSIGCKEGWNRSLVDVSSSVLGDSDMWGTWKFQRPEGLYNIIALRNYATPEEMIKRFDFGICQVGIANNKVIATDHFINDVIHSTFTLLRYDNPKGIERSWKRFDRLTKEKFQGFTLEDKDAKDVYDMMTDKVSCYLAKFDAE